MEINEIKISQNEVLGIELIDNRWYSYTRLLGQWHLSEFNSGKTLCGCPMLSFNYTNDTPIDKRTKCEGCFDKRKELNQANMSSIKSTTTGRTPANRINKCNKPKSKGD